MPDPHRKAIIIGLSGPSSSGKTTLAKLLHSVFHNLPQKTNNTQRITSFIIHEDDFYLPDDKIPITTLPNGTQIQDWDTINAMDVSSLARTLSHVREHAELPPRLRSIQDLNEATDSGVSPETISEIRDTVSRRFATPSNFNSNSPGTGEGDVTLVFLEGFLLFAPPSSLGVSGGAGAKLTDVHDNIDLHLFLPAPYDLVKSRRESRSGYVTQGPAPLPQRSSVSGAERDEGKEVDLQKDEVKSERQTQNFWTDPPGYVDDIVWPRYVRDHAWLLLGEQGEDLRFVEDEAELIKKVGQGTNVRMDAAVNVAPGQGIKPMVEVLHWAVNEVETFWGANQL